MPVPGVEQALGVAEVSVRDSVLPPGEDLVVRFTEPLDPATVGPRSVLVSGTHRRRLSSSCVRVTADGIRIPAAALESVAPEHQVELRIEGGASPCALRSAGGAALAERYSLVFRLGRSDASDLTGPVLVGSRPEHLEGAAPPGASVELRFSEPVVAAGESVTLRVDGVDVRARVRSSTDRRRVIVRPERPFPPGAAVEVSLHRCLADDAGNPLVGASSSVRFRVRASSAHEIEEDFTSDEFLDRAASDCAWGEAGAPGLLVPRCGQRPLAAFDVDVDSTADLGDQDTVRFQILVRSDEVPRGVVSGLRVRFARATGAPPLRGAWIEAGATERDSLDPSFVGNRAAARLTAVADIGEPLAWEPDTRPDGHGGAWVDIPFGTPLELEPGRAVLLDATLAVEPGARVAAAPDRAFRALVRGAGREHLAPDAALLVTGGPPAARSLWYDAGTDAPRWRSAGVETESGPSASLPGTAHALAFQAAPADGTGRPDVSLASPWEEDLARLPSWRFVRFRVRFDGPPGDGAPRVDRISMPFDI